MRKYVFVTKAFGIIQIQARPRDEANEQFLRRGYSFTDIEEVR